ncbi:family 1 encapsulin nanocompartment shell protein [Thiohalomonas denitrificans]|uniref:family 1 encapsulin nanocompartment shell protein n=1 Tax=Thiohalomonas denitrificans TaxID=415747 RepID=UPI0026F30876|nr:family 1 encapsulin nanocompartment shell protein [Thiohalomonas denitrificans]
MSYLNRDAAAFDAHIWERIDSEAVDAARALITARCFLPVNGPYGVGLTSVELGEDGFHTEAREGEAEAVISRAVSVPMLGQAFSLSIRRIDAHLHMGQPMNFAPVQDAAEAIARREERFIYYGAPEMGLEGLLTCKGHHEVKAGDWSKFDKALEDVLSAVNTLDHSGFHGPYALTLSPALYNNLFRRYEGTDMLQLEHLRRLCELGVYKAPIEGGAVVDAHVGQIVIGQDMSAGYSRQDGIHYHLYLSESVITMVEEPEAVCIIG